MRRPFGDSLQQIKASATAQELEALIVLKQVDEARTKLANAETQPCHR